MFASNCKSEFFLFIVRVNQPPDLAELFLLMFFALKNAHNGLSVMDLFAHSAVTPFRMAIVAQCALLGPMLHGHRQLTLGATDGSL